MADAIVREMADAEIAQCERVLRRLPEWFGIEESLVRYVQSLSQLESYVAEVSGVVVGFIAVRSHNSASAEIHVMAVGPDHHGLGIGRALIDHVEVQLRARRIEFLQVKTMGPSRPNEHYARTRGFYEHLGFHPLEENDLWGPVNPCLIMVKHLGSG